MKNQSAPLADLFEQIDGILVINMDSSPERFAHFMSTVGVHLPAEKLERISAVAGRELPSYGKEPWFTDKTGERARFWGGTGGCALSHRNAIAHARGKGWRNVLIFEDDVCLEASDDAIPLITEVLKNRTGAYLFYVGYNKPAPRGKVIARNGGAAVWRTDGVLATHAYIVSSELYEPLLNAFPANDDDIWEWLAKYRAVDVLYRDFVPHWPGVSVYVLDPILFHQRDGVSDIGLNAAEGVEVANRLSPRKLKGWKKLLNKMLIPLRRLKTRLNSLRTYYRASTQGLPGYKKKRKDR